MVIGKIGPISEMGGCSQFSTRTQPTTPVLLMATLIFYFFYFITTTNPLLLMPTNAYFSHLISLPILLLNFWDLPFLRGIKIDLIMIWWTAVGTLFEYYWKRFCICPKATHVNYVRSVDVNIEWELGDSANLSDDKTILSNFPSAKTNSYLHDPVEKIRQRVSSEIFRSSHFANCLIRYIYVCISAIDRVGWGYLRLVFINLVSCPTAFVIPKHVCSD